MDRLYFQIEPIHSTTLLLPKAHLKFRHNEQTKKIEMYYNVPKELRTLESMVDSLADTKDWKAL